jgi:ketosteroid isomerase-like protein
MNRRNLITAGVAGVSAAALTPAKGAEPSDSSEGDLEKVKTLLKAHDSAMTSHDLKGALATLADDAAVMGTGPGEMWQGKEELKVAYEHFFMVFDKDKQDFTYKFRVGGLSAEMGWLMASGDVAGEKDGKKFTYPLNISLTVDKTNKDWKIASMHFSTLTGPKDN